MFAQDPSLRCDALWCGRHLEEPAALIFEGSRIKDGAMGILKDIQNRLNLWGRKEISFCELHVRYYVFFLNSMFGCYLKYPVVVIVIV
jgi:hypothetical protein